MAGRLYHRPRRAQAKTPAQALPYAQGGSVLFLGPLFVPKAMRPLLIAHRGDSSRAPENTVRAFRQAVDAGADWIETDLQITRDGHVVACHLVDAL